MIHTDDPDFTLYVGDVREEILSIADESVDCVVTSPPYWGLRDYGTAEWEGGDPDCDHLLDTQHQKQGKTSQRAGRTNVEEQRNDNFRSACGKCGAVRVDAQIGMEDTPQEYVETMVLLFREVRRVLKKTGTCWLNLGDSYMPDHAQKRNLPEGVHNYGIQAGTPGSRARDGRGPSGGLKKKELVGIPWRVALALQADGWWLRCDNVWEKLGGMPESVTDRPTRNHEYVFLLTKSASYFYDQDAVREPYTTKHAPGVKVTETDHYGASNGGNSGLSSELAKVKARLADVPGQETLDPSLPPEAPRLPDGRRKNAVKAGEHSAQHRDGDRWANDGRNMRSVWEIATAQLKEAHFAVFPDELPRRCIRAGSSEMGVCPDCGAPWKRDTVRVDQGYDGSKYGERVVAASGGAKSGGTAKSTLGSSGGKLTGKSMTLGWKPTCKHGLDPVPAVVFDPFMGSGTTARVARAAGRKVIGCELSREYADLIAKRTQQQSLFAEAS